MKKTLTVNLGGTVFHIDEDAYQLLDKYLSNLRIHFQKEESSDEILDDFEMRISELFSERIRLGYEVITVMHVEEMIKRMGRPEELFGEDFEEEFKHEKQSTIENEPGEKIHKRLFRNPDDRILGGVAGGFAAYMGWDPSAIRIALFLLMFFYGVTIPIYLVLWLIVPMAHTATEKLQMMGESITIENIGKTVTNGFEKVSGNVNEYIHSEESRSALQKAADVMVKILGAIIKVFAILIGILVLPPALLILFILVVVVFAVLFGGGVGFLYYLIPSVNWGMFSGYDSMPLLVGGVCAIFIIGIPAIAVLYSLCSYLFKFKPISSNVKVTLLVLWIIAVVINTVLTTRYGIPFLNSYDFNPAYWS